MTDIPSELGQDEWADEVDAKLKSLQLRSTVAIGIGLMGAVSGCLAIVSVGKVAKAVGQITTFLNQGQVVQQVQQPQAQAEQYQAKSKDDIGRAPMSGRQVDYTVPPKNDAVVIDETRFVPPGMKVGEPNLGPINELSDEQRQQVEYDPLNPGKMLKGGEGGLG